jgi:methyl-accepting chemotaxis protein
MLNKMKIAQKLIGGFLIVSVITLVIGVLGIVNVGKMNGMLKELYEKHLLGISEVKQANVNLICIGRAIRQSVAARSSEERLTIFEQAVKYDQGLKDNMAKLEKTLVTEDGKRKCAEVMRSESEMMSGIATYRQFAEKQALLKLDTTMLNQIEKVRSVINATDEQLSALAGMKEAVGKKMFEESDKAYENIRSLLIVLALAGTILGFIIGFFLSRSISRPLNRIVSAADSIAKKDLVAFGNLADTIAEGDTSKSVVVETKELTLHSEDELGKLAQSFNNIIVNLRDSGKSMGIMCDTLRGVISETNSLAQSASEGKLSSRGKADTYKGAYKDIIQGLNLTLEAVALPFQEASAVFEKLAAKDMTARMSGAYQGDFLRIKESVNSAADQIETALTQVSEGTEQVSSASQQISAGSQSLAQGANEQASSLEEISSSLEEMASMTKQNADNSNQAKNLAVEANGNAAQGKLAMTRMNESIEKIKKSSDETAKIVKTIDEIAMQTNLLALNAAVEAARAGEAGRGFAVVAEEVRNLAQRSADAAKNTANMIEESVNNAKEGVVIASEVVKSFEVIAASNAKVDNLIAEIAAASQEQSQGIDQVNTAVAQMDKVTQQNAANSEESASASEELSSQAEELQSMVAQFKLTNAGQRKTTKTVVHRGIDSAHEAKLAAEPKMGHKKDDFGASPKSTKESAHSAVKDRNPKKAIPFEEDEVLKEF